MLSPRQAKAEAKTNLEDWGKKMCMALNELQDALSENKSKNWKGQEERAWNIKLPAEQQGTADCFLSGLERAKEKKSIFAQHCFREAQHGHLSCLYKHSSHQVKRVSLRSRHSVIADANLFWTLACLCGKYGRVRPMHAHRHVSAQC